MMERGDSLLFKDISVSVRRGETATWPVSDPPEDRPAWRYGWSDTVRSRQTMGTGQGETDRV